MRILRFSLETSAKADSFVGCGFIPLIIFMRDLIFVSLENWDEIWRRNQFLCAQWAQRFPENQILFVGQNFFLPQWMKRRGLHQNPRFPNIHAMNVAKPLPNPAPFGRKTNELTAISQVNHAAKSLGMRDPLLWINPYDAGFYIGNLRHSGAIYDITDDWELAETDETRRAWLRSVDRELCRRADLTVVCSDALFEARKNTAKSLFLLYNGVEFEHYAASIAPKTEAKKVFGYTGSLHSWRVDLAILETLAARFPDAEIALVGPNYWPDDSLQKTLEKHPNIVATGAVAYSQIPAQMARFDVCIVPHHQNAFTESLNPLKLWEYLACGKPIVSTDVAGFRDYPQVVRLAKTPDEFANACAKALEERVSLPDSDDFADSLAGKRRETARAHSWESRFDALWARLQSESLV